MSRDQSPTSAERGACITSAGSALRFDQAPVVDGTHVVGWVVTAHLLNAERVKGVMKPLALSAIVSNEASIADVLQLLAQEGLVFTVGDNGVSGFITPSDLERHAARSHFYLLVAGIEMLITTIVAAQPGGQETRAGQPSSPPKCDAREPIAIEG